ncbi:MAG TPA: ATP-binding protein, partial [Anaerolineales bacterium]|nr:ATP-binding protein [Anaerolineales bacterium]
VRAIKLFAEVALRSTSIKAEIAEQFYAILGESERLFKLLDSMLIHGRLSKFAEKLEPASILKVLQALMKKLHPQIEEFHAQLTLPTTDGYILGNATLLYQIFANLLDNALKYRHPGMQPKIDVHISQQASHIQIEVADNGIGIPAEYFEKVFQIFQRVHTSEEYPGVGIGLATVKKSVELMNGSVKISSVINEGTTFHLTFPKANVEIGF